MHRQLFLLLLLSIFGIGMDSRSLADELQIDELEFVGLQRTDEKWLRSYLPIDCPCRLTSAQILTLQNKLMTTQVFLSVDMQLENLDDPDRYRLLILVEEKWTTIPVIRGAFGGGTPLLVAGIYDTHVLGELWTIGAEVHKYGSASPGGVVWTRFPRWMTGRHYLNLELWKDRRLRSLYNDSYISVGEIQTDATIIRGDMLFPMSFADNWQFGFHIESRDLVNSSVRIDRPIMPKLEQRIASIVSADNSQTGFQKTLLRLVYDDVSINQLQYHGIRLILSSGPVFRGNRAGNFHEVEGFAYYQWPGDWNFASRAYLSASSDQSMASQQFLGGLDSIRGLPDGAIFGTKAGYLNLEMRHLGWQWPYLEVQNVIFTDIGSASSDWQSFRKDWRASSGVGIRLSIPQVHRLVFRIDYAWSLDDYGASGITAGMYQFFQPYRPL
ncbi:MAG: ShlB/FhaC/HecB family hemolysin secretion/activation protein [Oligoflexus sp.]